MTALETPLAPRSNPSPQSRISEQGSKAHGFNRGSANRFLGNWTLDTLCAKSSEHIAPDQGCFPQLLKKNLPNHPDGAHPSICERVRPEGQACMSCIYGKAAALWCWPCEGRIVTGNSLSCPPTHRFVNMFADLLHVGQTRSSCSMRLVVVSILPASRTRSTRALQDSVQRTTFLMNHGSPLAINMVAGARIFRP